MVYLLSLGFWVGRTVREHFVRFDGHLSRFFLHIALLRWSCGRCLELHGMDVFLAIPVEWLLGLVVVLLHRVRREMFGVRGRALRVVDGIRWAVGGEGEFQ